MKDEGSSEATVSREVVRSAPRAVRGAVLHVVHPPEMAATIAVASARTVFGRDAGSADAVLDHPTVSRRHFAFEWDGRQGKHVVSDLGSRNGSHVDGQPLKATRPLADGAALRFGDVIAVYELG